MGVKEIVQDAREGLAFVVRGFSTVAGETDEIRDTGRSQIAEEGVWPGWRGIPNQHRAATGSVSPPEVNPGA